MKAVNWKHLQMSKHLSSYHTVHPGISGVCYGATTNDSKLCMYSTQASRKNAHTHMCITHTHACTHVCITHAHTCTHTCLHMQTKSTKKEFAKLSV